MANIGEKRFRKQVNNRSGLSDVLSEYYRPTVNADISYKLVNVLHTQTKPFQRIKKRHHAHINQVDLSLKSLSRIEYLLVVSLLTQLSL